MFKQALKEKLEKIFGFDKVTFDAPSEQFEQDTLFIEIRECLPRMTRNGGGRQTAIVKGSLVVFSTANSLSYGFFNKRLEQADAADKNDIAFFAIDTDVLSSQARVMNIHERRCDFVYTYKDQYDPNQGEIEGFESTIETLGS